jgi:NLI interacting factor-like phosphatase
VSVRILALDLERTLISDAMSADPRPGLFEFLSFCESHFERLVLFTSVETADAREVLAGLARSGYVPPDFLAKLEYVEWGGEFKDLAFVPDADPDVVLLVDDDAGWVRPEQRGRWIAVSPWDGGPDSDLLRVRSVLKQWLDAQ